MHDPIYVTETVLQGLNIKVSKRENCDYYLGLNHQCAFIFNIVFEN